MFGLASQHGHKNIAANVCRFCERIKSFNNEQSIILAYSMQEDEQLKEEMGDATYGCILQFFRPFSSREITILRILQPAIPSYSIVPRIPSQLPTST